MICWMGQQRNRGLFSGRSKRWFSLLKHPNRGWRPPGLLVSGYWRCIKNRLKRPGRGADNFNAEVKIYVHLSVCLEVLLLMWPECILFFLESVKYSKTKIDSKVEVFLISSMKVYRGSRGITQFILNHRTRWR